MAEVFNNLVRSTLASGISAVATSLTVQSGDGNLLFPAPTGGDFGRLAVYKKATGDIEHMTYDARTADVLTITRATEGIGNVAAVAFAFDAGDLVELRPTAAFWSSLTVTSTDVQSGKFLYGDTDTGTADAYVFAFSPVVVSYVAGMEVRAKVANSCTGGACTIDFGPGVKTVVMEDGSTPPAGAIRALYTHTFRYDGTNVVLQSTGLALTESAGFNALGKQIKNVAAGTAATDVATIGGTEVHTDKTYTSPVINTPTINTPTFTNAFHGALVCDSTSQSCNNGTNTTINFDTEIYDTDSIHDNVTNNTRLTVPSGYDYARLTFRCTFNISSVGTRAASITKNGVQFFNGGTTRETWNAPIASVGERIVTSPWLEVSASDYFEVVVWQSSGGALLLILDAVAQSSWFGIELRN